MGETKYAPTSIPSSLANRQASKGQVKWARPGKCKNEHELIFFVKYKAPLGREDVDALKKN